MLTIRPDQMRVLAAASEEAFKTRLLSHACGVLREAGRKMSREELELQLDRGLARGKRYFDKEPDVARYVRIVLLHLGSWADEEHPERARRILSSKVMKPERRLDRFEAWAVMMKKARAGRGDVR